MEEQGIQSIKDVTSTARCMTKALDASLSLRAFQKLNLDLEKATQEAQRINALGFLTDSFNQAKNIEASGNIGIENLKKPYRPILSKTPAKITDPAVGASP